MSDTKVGCSVEVWDASHWHKYPCSKSATVERNGKWYCTIHDPERVKARNVKRRAQWAHEDKVRDARSAVTTAEKRILERIREGDCDGNSLVVWTADLRALDKAVKDAEEAKP